MSSLHTFCPEASYLLLQTRIWNRFHYTESSHLNLIRSHSETPKSCLWTAVGAVMDSSQFDCALSGTALSLVQRCPVYSAQSDSVRKEAKHMQQNEAIYSILIIF